MNSSYKFSRTRLTAGELLFIWYSNATEPSGPMGVITFVNSAGESFTPERSWVRRPAEDESRFWEALKIGHPVMQPPGHYQVLNGDDVIGEIDIVGFPNKRKFMTCDPSVPISVINEYLSDGVNIELTPGLHIWAEPVVLHPNTELRGYGATVLGHTEAYQNALVLLGNESVVRGITFQPDNAAFAGQYFGSGKENFVDHANILDCKFQSGMFGIFSHPNIAVKGCQFDRCTVTHVHAGLWLCCSFSNIGLMEHAFKAVNADGLALVEASFDKTDRGVIIAGDAKRCLFAGINFRDINCRVPNGSEIGCFEGAGGSVEDCLFFGWRTNNCPGPFQPFDSGFRRNRIQDFKFDQTWIIFWGMDHQSDNLIIDCQLIGGGIILNHPGYQKAQRNRLERVACLDFRLTSQNQLSGDPFYYKRPDMAVIGDYSGQPPTNNYANVTVLGSGPDRAVMYNLNPAQRSF